MALVDRLATPPAARQGMPCSVGTLLDKLKGAEHKALLAMLGTPDNWGWSQDAIYDAITAEGYQVGRTSINKHRGGKCRCPVTS